MQDTSLFEASYAAFNEDDIDSLLELYSEDCVWDMSRFPGAGLGPAEVYSGHDGLRQFLEEFRTFIEPWGGARTELDRVLDLGDSRFWLEGRSRLGSVASDTELVDEWIQLITVGEGDRIAAVVMYWDPEEARRDAGLAKVPAP